MRHNSGNFRKRSDSGRQERPFNRERSGGSDSSRRDSFGSDRTRSRSNEGRSNDKPRYSPRGERSSGRGGHSRGREDQVEWKPRLKTTEDESFNVTRTSWNDRTTRHDDDYDGDEMPTDTSRNERQKSTKTIERKPREGRDNTLDGDKPRVVRSITREKNNDYNTNRSTGIESDWNDGGDRYDRGNGERRFDRNKREGQNDNGERPGRTKSFYRGDRGEYKEGRNNRIGWTERNYTPYAGGREEHQDKKSGTRKRIEGGYKSERTFKGFDKNELFRSDNDEANSERKFKPKPNYEEVPIKATDGTIRLNKYISNSGVCSRREADEIITEGKVKVNGQVITELGTKVKLTDTITYKGKTLIPEKKVYILVNKPKDCVTTKDDPEERFTVFDLLKGACNEQLHAVGRLDRNTTGVLLLTNDGELTQKLTHPKFNKKKIYHVWLDNNISDEDLRQLNDGIQLDDGFVRPDEISFVEPGDRKQLGVEIHSGQNRVVRRMFEHFNYKVVKLDRVYFAGLTKKSVPRGEWRFLSNEEVNILKRLSTR